MKRTFVIIATAAVIGTTVAAQRAEPNGDGHFLAQYALPEGGPRSLSGTVQEQIPAGGYVYLRVRPTRGDDFWVASLRRAHSAPWSEVKVTAFARADNFRSKRLNRDFALLWFGSVKPLNPQPK